MGYYGKVFTRVWRDEKFRALPEDGRELFLYLLTSPHLNIVGFYYLPPAYAADDLQWPVEKVHKCIGSIEPLAKFDRANSVVLIPNYLKWNPFDNLNQAKGGAANLKDLPRTPLITEFRHVVGQFAKGYEAAFQDAWEEFGNPLETPSEPFGNPFETPSNSATAAATTTAAVTTEDLSSPPEESTEDTTTTEAPEEPDSNSRSEAQRRIFDHWNSQGIVQHRKMTDKMRRTINARLRDYSEAEICLAMDNYGRVIRSPDQFFFTYRWTLEDFLGRGFEKFRDWNTVCVNFSHKPRSRDAPMTNAQRALEVARKFATEGEGQL